MLNRTATTLSKVLAPRFWMPVEVHYRDNEDVGAFNRINDAIREPGSSAPSKLVTQRAPGLRMGQNPAEGRPHLGDEFKSQTGHSLLVLARGFFDLARCRGKKPVGHGRKPASISRSVSSPSSGLSFPFR
jgi:hypothetical protein